MKISRPETMSGKIRHLEKFLCRKISKLDEVKGVVRSKIEFFENWICESRRPMRDIAFYPNKIGQKLTENWGVKYPFLKTQYLSDFG